MKLSSNELSLLLVTHMVKSNARFGSNGLLKSGQDTENILDRLVIQANGLVLGQKMHETCRVWTQILKVTCYAFQCLLIDMFLTPTATVMAILVQPHAEFAVSWKSGSWMS
jgi:hypothetical protein